MFNFKLFFVNVDTLWYVRKARRTNLLKLLLCIFHLYWVTRRLGFPGTAPVLGLLFWQLGRCGEHNNQYKNEQKHPIVKMMIQILSMMVKLQVCSHVCTVRHVDEAVLGGKPLRKGCDDSL